jgi:hypothetical protein
VRVYTVGELYDPDRPGGWPQTPHLAVIGSTAELVLSVNAPTADEVAAVETGRVQFAWVGSDHVGVLAFRFGGFRFGDGFPWCDCPYNPNRQTVDRPGLLSGTVFVMLVDADTGILRAIRGLRWPPRFVATVNASIKQMLGTPFSDTAEGHALEYLYGRWPTAADLVRERADVQCTIGR